MSCPAHATCYDCEREAYRDGADWVDEGECPCGCIRVAVWDSETLCLACEEEKAA